MGVQPVVALLEALETQVAIGGHVGASQLALDSPCTGWSVRNVMNHSIAVTLKFADFATGSAESINRRRPPHERV